MGRRSADADEDDDNTAKDRLSPSLPAESPQPGRLDVAVNPALNPAVAVVPSFAGVTSAGPQPVPDAAPASADSALHQRLVDTVQQLMVSAPATADGHASAQVRMVLQDSVLPGTTVTVQQVGARLQVSFDCTVQASRQRLDRAAPAFAQALARRLGRDVEVRVDDDSGHALLPVQARADTSQGSL